LEDALHVGRLARLDEVAREVRAADELRILGEALRTREAAVNARGRKAVGDSLRAGRAPLPDRFQAVAQRAGARIDAKADDVDGAAAPGHRDLDAVDETKPARTGLGARLGEPGGVVVIGEREDFDAVGRRAGDYLLRGQQSV